MVKTDFRIGESTAIQWYRFLADMSRRIPSVVAAQLPGKLLQREDAALLGALAPGLPAQRVSPIGPNRMRSIISMRLTPSRLCCA